MRIAVFGATGGTGRHLVDQALADGHQVVALARHPEKLGSSPGLTTVEGNVLDAARVAQAVDEADAVCCVLGNTPDNPKMIVSAGTANVITAMKAHDVRRLVVVSSIGIGDSRKQVPLAFRLVFNAVPSMRMAMDDKEAQEKLVRESGLDWVIVRPGGLTDGPRTGKYTHGLDKKIIAGQIARANVAEFVLRQTADDTYLHQAVAVT